MFARHHHSPPVQGPHYIIGFFSGASGLPPWGCTAMRVETRAKIASVNLVQKHHAAPAGGKVMAPIYCSYYKPSPTFQWGFARLMRITTGIGALRVSRKSSQHSLHHLDSIPGLQQIRSCPLRQSSVPCSTPFVRTFVRSAHCQLFRGRKCVTLWRRCLYVLLFKLAPP